MRSEEEIRKFIEYAREEREKAQNKLDMRTSVYLEGVINSLYWVLKEKDIESGLYKKKI